MTTVPVMLTEKVHRIREEMQAARRPDAVGSASRHTLVVTQEVLPGVRLVLSQVGDIALVFTLWESIDDVVQLCNDAAVPANSLLLAIDDEQLLAVQSSGRPLAMQMLSPSESQPGLRYILLHYRNRRQIRRLLHRLVLPSGPATAAA